MLARLFVFLFLLLVLNFGHFSESQAQGFWGFGVSGSRFQDADFIGTTDSSIGLGIFSQYGWNIEEKFNLAIELDITGSRPKFSGENFWHLSHFFGLQAEYRFLPKLILALGPGYTGNHRLKKDSQPSDTRHGAGVLGKIGYEFYRTSSLAFDFQFRGLLQGFSSENGALAYLAGAGFGLRFH